MMATIAFIATISQKSSNLNSHTRIEAILRNPPHKYNSAIADFLFIYFQ